jgi:hypothetical protein
LELPPLWTPITSCAHLQLRWGFKKKCSPRGKLSNDMWHIICTHVIQRDSQLLMVGSFDISFGHNLCCKYSNGSWKPILNIYVLRNFQCYKKVLNPMNFESSKQIENLRLHRDSNSQSGNPPWTHTLSRIPGNVSVTPKLHSWPTPFHALTLVASPRLRLWHQCLSYSFSNFK